MTDSPSAWSWSAVWRAAASVSVFALPLGVLQNWLVGSDRIASDGPANFVLYGLILICGVIGGFGAASLVERAKLQHGAAAAAIATAGIHLVGAIRRAVTGDEGPTAVSWMVAVVFTALLMSLCGMIGAVLERRTRALRSRPTVREGS